MPQTKEDIIKRINNDFVYHPPFGNQVERYASIREYGRQMAIQIVQDTPVSREQSLALTLLEQAIFYANAAIARNEMPPQKSTCYFCEKEKDKGAFLSPPDYRIPSRVWVCDECMDA